MKNSATQKNTVSERPPVVVVMGHIDHGKSTLLDYIRKTKIVDKEAGGITQHVSAYEATCEVEGKNRRVTFLDTPGHEAFQSLRSRGAKVADVAILVVSVEDGVKAQTLEALARIKEQNIPFVVAINKIDRPNADVNRAKQSLAENEIYVEGYGGTVSCVPISAKTGQGIPELIEVVFLATDLQELKGDTSKSGSGIVIESKLDPRKGISATLIVKDGTIKTGQFAVAGTSYTPVRIMEDDTGKKISTASFSSPITITGWSELVPAGADFKTFETKNDALEFIEENKKQITDTGNTANNDTNQDIATLPLIVKADTLGSLEAIKYEIGKINDERIKPKIVSSGIGTVSENDVKVAGTSQGTVILSFNVKSDSAAKILAERDGVMIENFSIIYKLTEKVKELADDRAPKIKVEETTGTARILRTFSRQKDKQVVGGKVDEGSIAVGEIVKIVRRESEIGSGKVKGLQQQKTEVKEVPAGKEFGALIESKFEIAVGDTIRSYKVVEK